MKISLVIPAYNEEKFLQKCLESVFRQTRVPDEVIVVDNNSRDSTAAIAARFPVRVIREKKQGIVHARTAGYDAAKYEIIARCDADEILPENWVERILWNFERYDIDALTGPMTFYDGSLNWMLLGNAFLLCMKCAQGWREPLIGGNMALKRDVWLRVRSRLHTDDRKVHEDIDLGINILRMGGRIRRDKKLWVRSSGRRMVSRPVSFFIEYPARLMKTIVRNAHPARSVSTTDRIRPRRRRLASAASSLRRSAGKMRAPRFRGRTARAPRPAPVASPPTRRSAVPSQKVNIAARRGA